MVYRKIVTGVTPRELSLTVGRRALTPLRLRSQPIQSMGRQANLLRQEVGDANL